MKIFLTITLLLLTILPASAVKKIQANPINLAITLVEKTDSTKIASMLEYYGYTLHDTENGYCIMKHPNGTEIRFTFNENGTSSKYPTVTVKHNSTERDLSSRLKELDFEKSGNGFEKAKNAYSRYSIQCTTDSHNILTFRHIQH